MNQISQRELKEQIVENPNLTYEEKMRELNRLRRPYQAMGDEELLQLVRDFVKENDRLPIRKDLIYDTVLKQRFGPWGRMLEQAGVKEVAYTYLERRRRRKEKRIRHKEYRRQIRAQEAAMKLAVGEQCAEKFEETTSA